MSDKASLAQKRTEVLLTLRDCARSWPAELGRRVGIPRTTAGHHIKKLEEDGVVEGYTPIVRTDFFGEPYLLRILVNPSEYQFEKDADLKIEAIGEFLKEAVGHAPVSFFVFSDGNKEWIVNCVTVTNDPQKLVSRLEVELNIAREKISTVRLDKIEGIPNYGKYSILTEGQKITGR